MVYSARFRYSNWWKAAICLLVAQFAPVQAGLGLFPVAAYTPETGAILGAYLQQVESGDSLNRPSQVALWLTAAARGQAELGLRPELWWMGNGWKATGELSYQHWPASWHGPGAQSPATATPFTAQRVKVDATLKRRVMPGFHAGPCLLVLRESLTGEAARGELATASGLDVGAGLELALDTRDQTLWPQSGWLLCARASRHGAALGGDWAYSRWLADSRAYGQLAGGVLAVQLAVEGRGGAVPLRALPKLSDWLRAVDDLRLVDRWAGALRLEWRRDIRPPLPTRLGRALSQRAGLVAFVESGQVGSRADQLVSAVPRISLGLGGRLALLPAERLNARADLAFGMDGPALRINVGEEF